MTCPRCTKRGRPDHFASEPKCAFPDGEAFKADNWQCATMGILRDVAHAVEIGEDDHFALLQYPNSAETIFLTYYKHRGRTSNAWRCLRNGTRVALTLDDVDRFLRERSGS